MSNVQTIAPTVSGGKRAHKASFSNDKKRGGYNICVEGPKANMFAGRIVPVTKKDGTETEEKLVRLTWSGPDPETGKFLAFYTFEPHPPADEELPF